MSIFYLPSEAQNTDIMPTFKTTYHDNMLLALQLSIMLITLFTLYSDVTGFSYIWDDNTIRQVFPYLTAEPDIVVAFSHWFLTPEYYRPLATYTMMIEYHLGTPELAPYFAHSINLGLFALCASLVFVITTKLCRILNTKPQIWPCIISLMFVCHPALLAGPAWAAIRFDLLMTTFSLMTLAADTLLPRNRYSILLTSTLFLCAAFSKETALSLALLLPFWHLLITNKRWQGWRNYAAWITTGRYLHTYIAIAGAGTIYLLIRFYNTGLSSVVSSARDVGSLLEHALYVGKTFIMYLHLIIWPFDILSPAYTQTVPIPLSDLTAVTGLALLALTAALGIYAPSSRIKWALLILLASLFPVLNLKILNIFDNIIDMRYTYLPITMLCLCMAALLPDSVHKLLAPLRILIAAAFALWILAGFIYIKAALPHWKDELSFWQWYVAKAPASHNAHLNLGSAYLERGMYPEAITQTLMALHDSRTAVPTGILMNLGVAYVRSGDYANGIDTLGKIKNVEIAPQYASVILAYYAEACIRAGNTDANAENDLRDALQLDPNNLHAHIVLAHYYQITGQADKKAAALVEARRLNGGNNAALINTVQSMSLSAEELLGQ